MFVVGMGDKMSYIVAIDDMGQMFKEYMRPYRVNGIPHAFILGKDGKVAWHGHPAEGEFERQLSVVSSPYSTPSSAGTKVHPSPRSYHRPVHARHS